MKRIINAFERLIFPLIRINWFKFFSLNDKNSKIIVISSLATNKKFSSEIFAWELGLIKGLINIDEKFDYKRLNGKERI